MMEFEYGCTDPQTPTHFQALRFYAYANYPLRQRLITLFGWALMLSVSWVTQAQTAGTRPPELTPQEVVGRAIAEFQDVLSQAIKHPSESPPDPLTTMDRVIARNADIPHMSRLVLGGHWWKASGEEQKQFIGLFQRFASRLATLMVSLGTPTDASGINIIFLPVRNVNDNRHHTMVYTLVSSGSDKIRMDYCLHRQQDRWTIYDVVVDGVGLIKPVRASVDSVVRTGGIDGLIARIEHKVTQGLTLR
jgi:phospholipid transport system substrate-binding protein